MILKEHESAKVIPYYESIPIPDISNKKMSKECKTQSEKNVIKNKTKLCKGDLSVIKVGKKRIVDPLIFNQDKRCTGKIDNNYLSCFLKSHLISNFKI